MSGRVLARLNISFLGLVYRAGLGHVSSSVLLEGLWTMMSDGIVDGVVLLVIKMVRN